MTTTQKKEVFDKLKVVVSKIIFEREFNPPPIVALQEKNFLNDLMISLLFFKVHLLEVV